MKDPLVCCFAVSDLPRPLLPSQQKECGDCGEKVWLSDVTVGIVREEHGSLKNLKLLCMKCFSKADPETMELSVTGFRKSIEKVRTEVN